MSLRRKLLLVFMGLAVVPITLVGVAVAIATLHVAQRQARDDLIRSMETLVDATAHDLEMKGKILDRTVAEFTALFDRATALGTPTPRSLPVPLLQPGMASPEIRILRRGAEQVESRIAVQGVRGPEWKVEASP